MNNTNINNNKTVRVNTVRTTIRILATATTTNIKKLQEKREPKRIKVRTTRTSTTITQ